MKPEASKTGLQGVLIIKPTTRFQDTRGEFVELYNEESYKEVAPGIRFIQDDISTGYKNVLRGIHGDTKTWKLVSCLSGRVHFVALNWDSDSPEYRKWMTIVLSGTNRTQILIPPRFGIGYLILSKSAIFHYKQSTNYDSDSQFTVRWDDPKLGIYWPVKNPILSKRDANA